MLSPRFCRLFLFDLDGTLIDSREDIARALNAVLTRMGQRALSIPKVVRFVGDGIEALMQRALHDVMGDEPDANLVRAGVNMMIEEYGKHLLDATYLYPDVRTTLEALRWAKLGLISNKPESLSRRILSALDLAGHFSVVLGGDSMPQRKPDPAPILEAMARCDTLPCETVMVGDSRIDILAGKAAGVITCGVSCGYRGREELEAAGCDLIIDHFHELLKCFRAPSG